MTRILHFRDRWVFIPPINSNSDDLFTPFSVRINHLLDSRYEIMSPNKRESITRTSLFTIKTLTSFKELHPFFNVLSVLPRNDSENLSNGLPICNFDKVDKIFLSRTTFINNLLILRIFNKFRPTI